MLEPQVYGILFKVLKFDNVLWTSDCPEQELISECAVLVQVEVTSTTRSSSASHSGTQMMCSGNFLVEGTRFHSTSLVSSLSGLLSTWCHHDSQEDWWCLFCLTLVSCHLTCHLGILMVSFLFSGTFLNFYLAH